MFIFIIILIIIIYNSQNSTNSQNHRPTRNASYQQQMRNRAMQQQMRQNMNNLMNSAMQQQMQRNLEQAMKNNPYMRNNFSSTGYSNAQNPYNANMTNYGRNTNPNTPYTTPGTAVNSYGLPTAPKKRTKIVRKFSEQYGLNLSDRDIKNIVDASYMSSAWSREICYMNQKYETIFSWFGTSNSWLKAYMFAFPMQQISTDFAMQEQIVYNAFDQIFSAVLTKPNITVPEAIWEINSKFYTQFDESTFMIAYRFMEQKGKKYPLNLGEVVQGYSDIDDLLSKYEQTGTPMH